MALLFGWLGVPAWGGAHQTPDFPNGQSVGGEGLGKDQASLPHTLVPASIQAVVGVSGKSSHRCHQNVIAGQEPEGSACGWP